MDIGGFFRRQGEIVMGVGAIGGVITATFLFFGGHNPVVMVSQYDQDKRTSAQLQDATAQTLKQINQDIQASRKRMDGEDCEKLSGQLALANAALAKHPDDPAYQALRSATLSKVRELENCQP